MTYLPRAGWILALSLVAAACGSEAPPDDGGDDDGGVTTVGEPAAPVTSGLVVSEASGEMGHDVMAGGFVTVDVYAGDPNGIGDIVSAALTSEDGQIVYAPLELLEQAQGKAGGASLYLFRAVLTFEGMNEAQPFFFDEDGEDRRTITATFVDAGGLVGAESTHVDAIGPPGCQGQLCGDQCVNVLSDVNHCGGCGSPCSAPNNTCVEGNCIYQGSTGWSECLSASSTITCADHCASLNRTCTPACGVLLGSTNYDGLSVHEYTDEACSFSEGGTAPLHDTEAACNAPLSQFGAESARCCCI